MGTCLAAMATGANSAPTPQLAHDINVGPSGSRPGAGVVAGDYLYFQASDGVHGSELWRTDGTTAQMVRDIRPGPASSGVTKLVALGNHVYFRADDGVHGAELWRSDGTTTEMVRDIRPGASGSDVDWLTAYDGWVYFSAVDGTNGNELWRSNGATTEMWRDIVPGSGSSYPHTLTVSGSWLYFGASNGVTYHLHRTNGSVSSVWNAGGDPTSPTNLVDHNGRLFLSAVTVATGRELWHVSGNTLQEIEINPGANGSSPSYLQSLGDHLYFSATHGTAGREPWRTDGVTTGMIADLAAGSAGSNPMHFVSLAGRVHFITDLPAFGREVWSTTGVGATLLGETVPGADGEVYGLTVHDGRLYIAGSHPALGSELWVSDGGAPTLLADLFPGNEGSDPDDFKSFRGDLYFTANDGTRGREVWRLAEPPAPTPPPAPPVTPGPGTQPPAADRSVTLALISKGTLRANRNGILTLAVRCPASEANPPCRGTVVLRTRNRTKLSNRPGARAQQVILARASFRVAAGKRANVRLRLAPARQRLLRTTPRMRPAVATITVRDRVNNRRVLRLAFRVLVTQPAALGGRR